MVNANQIVENNFPIRIALERERFVIVHLKRHWEKEKFFGN